jgi:hypothetical protein
MRRFVFFVVALFGSAGLAHCSETSDAPEPVVETPEHDAGAPSRAVDDAGARPNASSRPDASSDAGTTDARVNLPQEAGSRDAGISAVDAGPAPRDAGRAPDSGTAGDAACPYTGHVTYTLERESAPTAAQQDAYTKIEQAMKRAVDIYNCQADITKALRIQYNPSVQTADGNANGTIRFGNPSTFEHTRAMHEIAHTVGVGTASRWASLLRDGLFTGERATAQLRKLTGKADDVVHADSQHFWPYGLNYASEVKSDADLVGHCLMVVAIRADLGL